jgi:hypothetical protein
MNVRIEKKDLKQATLTALATLNRVFFIGLPKSCPIPAQVLPNTCPIPTLSKNNTLIHNCICVLFF